MQLIVAGVTGFTGISYAHSWLTHHWKVCASCLTYPDLVHIAHCLVEFHWLRTLQSRERLGGQEVGREGRVE